MSEQGEFEALRAALSLCEERVRDIVERNADGIVVIDRTGVVRFANPAAVRLLGRPIAEVVGAPFGIPVVSGESAEVDLVRRIGPSIIADMRVVPTNWEGEPALLASLRDVTRQHEQEEALRRKEDQLRKAQKLEAVGRLAAEVAHDVNNLLMGMSGCVHLALEELPEGHPARAYVEEIERASRQGASLTRQLLAFNRRRAVTPAVLDLNEIVHDLEVLVRRLVGAEIEVTCALSPDLWHVEADRGQLEQVLMNLVVNARDAMAERGSLRITTTNAPSSAQHGEEVSLEVTDDGCGMAPEVIARVFEPFFTTKPEGLGTGIGLSTVDSIVREAGGRVSIDSQVGKGTTFRVLLPRAHHKTPAHAPTADSSSASRGNGETILLVDDDDRVRTSMARQLERRGFSVVAAESGERALQLLSDSALRVDLLLTDIRMPGMNGRDLAQRATALRPELRVLYMSGYSGSLLAQRKLLQAEAALIEKPFTIDALLRAVHGLLTPRSPRAEASATPATPTLLIVEDERFARAALASYLCDSFTVLEASSAREALSLAASTSRIDLLLSDINLPDAQARGLLQQLRQSHPSVVAVFMSGFSEDEAIDRDLVEPGVPFLSKPVEMDAVQELLSRLVGGG